MSEQSHRSTQITPFHLVVIGAGASGLACAIRMAQVLDAHDLRDAVRIEVYEASRKVGHSILASGNGRCNYSNTKIYETANTDVSTDPNTGSSTDPNTGSSTDPSTDPIATAEQFYTHADFVEKVRAACCGQCAPAPEWLSTLGLLGREVKTHEGMLFPVSNQAHNVLDTLLSWCEVYNIAIVPQTRVETLSRRPEGRFVISGIRSVPLDAGMMVRQGAKKKKAKKPQYQEVPFSRSADAIVLAVGRALYDTPQLALSHPLAPMHPVLGPLRATLSDVPEAAHWNNVLDGVRQQVALRVVSRHSNRCAFTEVGEVLFRSYGISGIVVFNASRFAQPGDRIELDLLPDFSSDTLMRHLMQTYQVWKAAERDVEQETLGNMIDALLTGVFAEPLRNVIAVRVCTSMQVGSDVPLAAGLFSNKARTLCECITQASKHVVLTVEGIAADQACQVMRGGCKVDVLNPETCESCIVPQLYITGEALDVDGPCGGFNLDWAWTSGIVAGEALARNVMQHHARESLI